MADTDPDRGEFLARGRAPRKTKARGPAPVDDAPPFDDSKPVEPKPVPASGGFVTSTPAGLVGERGIEEVRRVSDLPTQALTIPQQAEKALQFVDTKARLVAMVEDTKTITAISDKAGYDLVHAAYMRLKNTRVAVEKIGKEARDDANKFRAAVIEKEDELVAIIAPEEKRLLALRDVEDQKAEKIKADRIEAERKRRQTFEDDIAVMRGAPMRVIGKPAEAIETELALLRMDVLSRFDDEYLPAAQRARDEAIELLARMLAERKQLDADRAEADAARAENARVAAENQATADRLEAERKAAQAEQDRLQAIRDQEAADARAETARVEREAAEAENQRQAAERAEAQRIEDERIAGERAEAERIRKEQQDAEDAERKRLQDEQDEANRKERERMAQEAEDLRIREEAAEAERVRLEDERMANTSLADAARGALALLVNEGYGRRLETRTLRVALAKLAPKA